MNISQTFVFFFPGSSSICNLLNSVNRYCGSVLSDNNFATGDNLPVCGKLQICMMHASWNYLQIHLIFTAFFCAFDFIFTSSKYLSLVENIELPNKKLFKRQFQDLFSRQEQEGRSRLMINIKQKRKVTL